MSTPLINQIKSLTLSQKIALMELLFQDIKKETLTAVEADIQREKAAEILLADYENDSELTVFTSLDQEGFYEAR